MSSAGQNEAFGIGMNGEISAVSFGLYAAEDLTAADGSIIPADGLVEIVSISENGLGTVSTDLPMGSYYLKEQATDNHYILSDEKYPVVGYYTDTYFPEHNVRFIAVNDGVDSDQCVSSRRLHLGTWHRVNHSGICCDGAEHIDWSHHGRI